LHGTARSAEEVAMRLLAKVGTALLAWALVAGGLVAAVLLAVGAVGFALCFGLVYAWDWLDRRRVWLLRKRW
jgi:uncharacterized membrane protein